MDVGLAVSVRRYITGQEETVLKEESLEWKGEEEEEESTVETEKTK